MAVKITSIEDFTRQHLKDVSRHPGKVPFLVTELDTALQPISASQFNFHLVILCAEGTAAVTVAHHEFSIPAFTIAIIPPNTVFSLRYLSTDFKAQFLLFAPDFVKQGFIKSEIMEELLFINPDYPPIFDLGVDDYNDLLYKFRKIKEETEQQSAFCLDVCRLYLLQILYDYNRVCELCLLNSDKLINRQYQVMYAFRQLVDKNFTRFKTVQAYADLMFLSPKYVSECVKNQTGIAALTLIQKRIMLEAELQLKYSQLSIKLIAEQLGFNTTAAFSRFFKGLNGLSPIAYRNKPEN